MSTLTYAYPGAYDLDAASRREELVLEHLPQVRLVARRIHDRLPSHIALEDLISTGVVGLLAAIDDFDPSRNAQLNTYAEWRIRGAILDSLRDMDWAPRQTRKRAKLIQTAIRNLKQRFSREPAEEEIAAELDVDLAEYQKWLLELETVELECLEGGSEDGTRRDLINEVSTGEESWPSSIVERSELERILGLAIDRMPETERTVLSLYYFEELTLREIAQVMGMHLSRIGQLRTHAILRLRSHLDRVWNNAPMLKQA